MVFLVPFDGSPLADAALDRAVTYADALETDVVAVSLIPTGSDYAQRRRRVDPTADFAAETASTELRRKIEETTDDAERNYSDSGAYTPDDGLTERVRQTARDVGASVLFVGADGNDSGERLRTPFGEVLGDAEYDIHVVRSA